MDRSALRHPDPFAPLRSDRRRTVRQRLHTPVYVSFNTPQSGTVVDLSELLDLHEYGFAVQTAIPSASSKANRLEVNRAVTLCLDLPETKQYVHGSGQVMWTDDAGRAGVRFSFLPDRSRQALKEWLFANLLVASTNHVARLSQLEHRRLEARASELNPGAPKPALHEQQRPVWHASEPDENEAAGPATDVSAELSDTGPALAEGRTLYPMPEAEPNSNWQAELTSNSAAAPDRAELLSELDELRWQIRELQGPDSEGGGAGLSADGGFSEANLAFERVLQLITGRAAGLTSASGASLALLTGDKFICRASVGDPAPPAGSEVDVSSGLSGECLRTGAVVSCTDSEADPRVDPEICRMLGIGSFMASPLFADFRVVGLIEIFSPYPHTFGETQKTILERLTELVPRVSFEKNDVAKTGATRVEMASIVSELVPLETEPAPARPSSAEQETPSAKQAAAECSTMEELRMEEASLQTNEHVAEEPVEPARSRRHSLPFSHLVLLVMVIAVSAMALGYLLAPTIERHWLRPAEAASEARPVAVDHRGHALSTDELRRLAEQGDADAQWQLGILYHDGDTVPKDDAMAVQWFEKAAEQGYVRAQSTLGAYYWAGRGVPPDLSKAYFWSQLALAQGDKDSKSRLEGLSAQMTLAQVASARQQAEAWLRAHNQAASSKTN